MASNVAIIGGGFAGTLQAINLLRHSGLSVTLIERRPQAGQGVAYGDADPVHVLNIRASGMSAFPDNPNHFVRWLKDRGRFAGADTFVQRKLYGTYLGDLLDKAMLQSPGALTVLNDTATDLRCSASGVRVGLASGSTLSADRAILAVGNLPPHAPPALNPANLDANCYFGDPWRTGAAARLPSADEVLILGTGLTMVDMVMKLQSEGFGGRITALSRRGLVPRAHGPQSPFQRITERPRPQCSSLLAAVRRRAATIGWRNAVDELRPFTQWLWQAASVEQRARFLRHLRPWWDMHRHRIAPPVMALLDELQEAGRLRVIAGKATDYVQCGSAIEVTFRQRGMQKEESGLFHRVINCIGPQGDITRTEEPLLQSLVARGLLRPDPLHLGIDVDAQHRVIDVNNVASDRLHAIGPMTRGAFWEIVAVPDIRMQTWSLARRLSNAHWVGGEGL